MDFLLGQQRTVVLKGVEVSGDPIFLKFKKDFERLDEVDFQNFWRIYFISLVNAHFIDSPSYANALAGAGSEIKEYRKLVRESGFPVSKSLLTYDGLVKWGLAKLSGTTFRAKVDPAGAITGEIEVKGETNGENDRVPIFVTQLHEALVRILKKSGLSLWIMLDRLDEVFPRRSDVERTALRALLRTTRSFRDSTIRLKLFIRDDIFDSITDVSGGFPALTHIVDRCSTTLRWSKDQIQDLIIKRVFATDRIANYFKINRDRMNKDQIYRLSLGRYILPERIRGGNNQSLTIDWIYKHCEDANGVVTPRDIIDLLILARGHQIDEFRSQPSDMSTLISAGAVVYGHRQMSMRKRENYLKAEFDHFWPNIEKFENKKADHHADSLRSLLGRDCAKIIKDLRSIGFLKYNPRTDTYSIPFLYRHCLNIRQGRASTKGAG